MKTLKFFFFALLTATILCSFCSEGLAFTKDDQPKPDCNLNISILFSEDTGSGIILKVVADGQCGFVEIDPSKFGIVWAANGTNVIGTGSNLALAPYNSGIEVTVKSIENGATAKAWFLTPPSLVIGPTLINAPSLPGISNTSKTKGN